MEQEDGDMPDVDPEQMLGKWHTDNKFLNVDSIQNLTQFQILLNSKFYSNFRLGLVK